MVYYQPGPTLTWKYFPTTGQLDVMASISLNLNSGELLTYNVSLVENNKIIITITIGSTGESAPLNLSIPVRTIEQNLSKDQVRDRIRTTGIQFTVYTSVYKNGKLEGESIATTSNNSTIDI